MQKNEIELAQISQLTNGKFVFVENFMEPQKSFAYGHLAHRSAIIKNGDTTHFLLEYQTNKKEERWILKTELIRELKRFEKEHQLRNLFEAETPKEYEQIFRLAASSINPYSVLSIQEKTEKMEQVFLAHPLFENLEQVDLFLVGVTRVKRYVSFDTYGKLEINFFANLWGDFFLLDKETESLFISKRQDEIERIILKRMNVAPEAKVRTENGRLLEKTEGQTIVFEPAV